ncbi:MAG: DUF4838 domain-containing protein, partial [Verrucomicrobiota bacterium]
SYSKSIKEWEAWNRHNLMGGPAEVKIHHSWFGLKPEEDFETHPEWFALTGGERRPTKPCYSHPEVIERAREYTLARARRGEPMITLSPPDGLGYCECDRCLKVLRGGERMREHRTVFARRPDGMLVNLTSENLFHFVNEVAGALSDRFPHTLIGCYAYSAYSHPPSFSLHDQVYVQVTTAFRRTSLSMADQFEAFGLKTRQLGVREYYSVYPWDWDEPYPGRVAPQRLKKDLTFFRNKGITAVNAEASNNWGARGLGYYVAARLMWDLRQDVDEIVDDFLTRAFGPAADAMGRYYHHWYGTDEERKKADVPTLRAAFADLDQAMEAAGDDKAVVARLDQLRMYLHYLVLRRKVECAGKAD